MSDKTFRKFTSAKSWLTDTHDNPPDSENHVERAFAVSYANMTDKEAEQIAELIRHHKTLKEVTFYGECQLSAEATKSIADAVAKNTNIIAFRNYSNTMGEAGIDAMISAIEQNPNMVHMSMLNNPANIAISEAQQDRIIDIFINPNTPHRNLQSLTIGSNSQPIEEIQPQLRKNQQAASSLIAEITGWEEKEPSSIATINFTANPRFNGLLLAVAGNPTSELRKNCHRLAHHVNEHLPPIKIGTLQSLEDLYKAQPAGSDKIGCLMPVDNPNFWKIFPEIAESFAAVGTPITKDFLMQPNRDGYPVLTNAILAGKFKETLAALNAQQEYVGIDDLFDHDDLPTPLFKSIITHGDYHALLSHDNAKHLSRSELSQVLEAIPPQDQPLIQNRHQLATAVSRGEQHETRLR